MRILVTGASGFIGSAFCRLALTHDYQIGGLILPTEQPPAGLPSGKDATWLKGTLADPPWDAIRAFRPEACVHFAWVATPGVYLESPENENYFNWSLQLLRRVSQLGAKYILGAGTCIEYRIGNEPLSEDHTPIEPATTYARWKNALRLALESDAREQGYRSSWGRVFYPYGLGEHPARLCSSIIQKLARDEPVVLKTPNSTKDYIYIKDLAAAFLTLLEKQYEGAINLGTGVGVTVHQIAQELAQMMGKPHLVSTAHLQALDPLGFVVADASRLRRLGWQPAYDLALGLRELLSAMT
jgi:dTDP-6-deoxy-L-talose 4-dehydrogenase (NAD+)